MLSKIYPYAVLILLFAHTLGQPQNTPETSLILTDIDNKTYNCQNITCDQDQKCLLSTTEGECLIPLNTIVEIKFTIKTSSRGSPYDMCEVILNNHDVIRGKFKSGAQDIIVVESPFLGTFSLNYEQLLMLRFSLQNKIKIPELKETDEDILTLINGDKDKGILTAITPENIVIKSSLFDKERIYKTADIAYIVFAQINPPTKTEEKQAVVITHAGSKLTGKIQQIVQKIVYFITPNDSKFKLPFDHLKTIYFKNPQWTYLSDMKPVEVKEYYPISAKPPVEIPFLWNYQRDKSIHEGKNIFLQKQVYYKGLGVHASCELTYQLNGLYKRFFAIVGLDDSSGPGGSVRFLVYADDNKIYESPIIKWNNKPDSVSLDISKAQKLKLVLTDADDGFTLDRAAWASARIVK